MGIEQGISLARRGDNTRAMGRVFLASAIALTGAAAYAFYAPAMRACGGDFPVPLDDVFIHFDFARSLAHGHPFEWIAGQGFSSGETSPLYAALLAIGWAVGFRAHALTWFAAAIACVSIASAMMSLRSLAAKAHVSIAIAASAFLVSIGALDFALFSGMEVAFFVALVFRAFVLADALPKTPPHLRASRQWKLGAMGALLVWTRPEAAVIVFVLAVFAGRHARSQSPLAAMVRVALPGALGTLAIAALNHAMTGDYASAGARLKLLTSNPYLSDLDRARELVLNVLFFAWKVLEGSAVATPRFVWLLAACALAPLASRRTRETGAAILASALLYALLVSFNGAARFQGFRYYAPAVALLVAACALGLGAIAKRFGTLPALALGAVLAGGAAMRAEAQSKFFSQASENIHDQQMRAGETLRTLAGAPRARVLLGDAGAIPYVSDRGAIDALGLGGFRRLPFTRAALSGEASTLELLQTLSPSERPALFALYPNWFPAITTRFGREIARVTIEHNVICGGPTKIIGLADWSTLDGDVAPEAALDELDVADVQSELDHAYESPAPRGGWAIVNVLASTRSEARAFDGGRVVPAGEREAFVARASADRVAVVMRSDEPIDAVVEVGKSHATLASEPLARGEGPRWIEARTAPLAIARGDRIVVVARAPLRDFHVWLVTP